MNYKILLPVSLALVFSSAVLAASPLALGGHRVLFVDDFLVAKRAGLELKLHTPRERETVLTFDAPWEGSGSDFERLIRVGDTLRMYYMATKLTSPDGKKIGGSAVVACVVEGLRGLCRHGTAPRRRLLGLLGGTAQQRFHRSLPAVLACPSTR